MLMGRLCRALGTLGRTWAFTPSEVEAIEDSEQKRNGSQETREELTAYRLPVQNPNGSLGRGTS